jgi:hypothetical protein
MSMSAPAALAALQAAAAAAELAQLQQALPVVPHHGRISSFGEYKRTAKRQQADADEELLLEQQEAAAAVAAAAAAASKRRKLSHEQQQQQQLKREGSAGGSRPVAAAGDAAGGDAKEHAAKQLRDFVKVRALPFMMVPVLNNGFWYNFVGSAAVHLPTVASGQVCMHSAARSAHAHATAVQLPCSLHCR